MSAGLYFTYGLVALLLAINALRRPVPPHRRLPPLWLPGMIASEAAGLWLGVMPAATVVAILTGALSDPIGQAGLLLTTVAWLGESVVWWRSRRGARLVGPLVDLPWLDRILVWRRRLPGDVSRREHPLSADLGMDLYRHRALTGPLPLVVFLHGGGWRGGHRRQGSLVMLYHLARCGWAVAAIDYPLSPKATFPDHLEGVRLALDWAEASPDVDGPVIVAGASAGAHLAAVAALTDPRLDGLVALYGVYDFLNRNRTRHDWPLIPTEVMKATPAESPERYRLASPLDLVHPQAPPTLLVVPTFDSLVPPPESHHFAAALREVGAEVDVLEVPWAQHAFDTVTGRRARAVAGAVADWLADRFAGSLSSALDGKGREGSPL